jgi:hypothetical protein
MISGCDIKDLMFRNETGGYPLFQKKKKKQRAQAIIAAASPGTLSISSQ